MPLTTEAAARKDRRAGVPSAMTHQHFAFIAQVIRTAPVPVGERLAWAKHVASELARTNPRFSPSRFLRACNPLLADD